MASSSIPPATLSLSSSRDNHTSSWILEFILGQPIPNYLANNIFLTLPFPSPTTLSPHLKKTILLRRIASDLPSISEQTLHSLELIEELDRDTQQQPSRLLKTAYCEAAVGSTVRFLRNGDLSEFFDAVDRIWKRRMGDLERSEANGLVSGRLLERKQKMEEAVGNFEIRDEVMGWGVEEGLEAVREYLREELQAMGPPFLEIAAKAVLEKEMEGKNVIDELRELDDDGDCTLKEGGEASDCNVIEELGLNSRETESAKLPGGERSVGFSDGPVEQGGDCNAMEELGLNSTEIDRARLPVFDRLPTPEVRKVKEALKTSCEDLQTMVEDPLPDAINAAARLLASKSEAVMHLKEPEENHSLLEGNQNKVDVSARVHSADKAAEVIHTEGTSVGIELNKDPNKVSSRSLMDWNPTARTYEWEDESLESASENAISPSKRFHLSSPRRKAVSPLKILEVKKVVRRRKIKRWTLLEEDTLRKAVQKHGRGNWKTILSCYPEIFEERTEVDLKDKWRNMTGR